MFLTYLLYVCWYLQFISWRFCQTIFSSKTKSTHRGYNILSTSADDACCFISEKLGLKNPEREIPQFSDIPFDTPKMLLESVHLFESCTWGNQATWMHDENTLQRKVSWRQKCYGGVFAIVYRWICALVLVPFEKLSWHKLPGWQFPKRLRFGCINPRIGMRCIWESSVMTITS